MCLAIPGKLMEVFDEHGLRMGLVDYSGTRQRACLEYVREAEPGQYVVVHAGFAISLLDEEEARKSLELWDALVERPAGEEPDRSGTPLDGPAPGNPGKEPS